MASEPRDRSAPATRRARERVGESEGRSPSDKTKVSSRAAATAFVFPTSSADPACVVISHHFRCLPELVFSSDAGCCLRWLS